ncbi:Rho termination factor, N-terminal domain [Geoalkalibacter ferrihydriticus]|uniref:SAP domain-containing protein n=2 Tax=Geoalkalibacter ferrihydriticus TaxID=392333 RepID=A0A0C2HKT8_9BACT|nr:Rho termination factor N-terminal domain-containing protein [Geoalkalibacter ferrihydriticus]KIH77636.1 SAP domain-containing protein [Geoalkalibacter ferrihydriticus DSM 17813]SDL71324.1 Rho termination factor, N-terminal domain [Geoalkalibacter ferrihydriticus]
MNVAEIREIAKTMGIKATSKMKKAELIQAIQRHEGNADCYGAPWRLECGQDDCLWRRDCQHQSH